MLRGWKLLDLFKTENASGNGEPRPASTAGGSAAAGAQTGEGRKARKAGVTTRANVASSTPETVVLHVRVRPAVAEAIGAAVEASPIEFANPSDFVRRAVEHELQRRGLVKTYR